MAKPWPYRPDFTPTAALLVYHPTYLYQHCTWIIIIITFSTTTGRSDYIKHRVYTKKALTILEKNPIKIYESSHGKNRHPCYGVFQWNIRIKSGKQRLSTISENQSFHSPLCPGLPLSNPFPQVDTHMNDQAFNPTGKLIMLQQSWGEKKQSPCESLVRLFAWPLKYLHHLHQDTAAGRAITWQKPLKQKIIWVITLMPLLFFNIRSELWKLFTVWWFCGENTNNLIKITSITLLSSVAIPEMTKIILKSC